MSLRFLVILCKMFKKKTRLRRALCRVLKRNIFEIEYCALFNWFFGCCKLVLLSLFQVLRLRLQLSNPFAQVPKRKTSKNNKRFVAALQAV